MELPPEPSPEPLPPRDGGTAAEPATDDLEPPAPKGSRRRAAKEPSRARPIEPITPLVRAPDDPGIEPPDEPAADRRHLHSS